jgi:hypothetical protein
MDFQFGVITVTSLIKMRLGIIHLEFIRENLFVIELVLLNNEKLMSRKVRRNENLLDVIIVQRCWLLKEQLVFEEKMGG